MLTDNQIYNLGRDIRLCYLQKQNSLNNNRFRLSDRLDKDDYWKRAASVCYKYKFSPEAFVERAFDLIDIITDITRKRGFSLLTPPMLYSKPFIKELDNDLLRNSSLSGLSDSDITPDKLRSLELKNYVNNYIQFYNDTVRCLTKNKTKNIKNVITMRAYNFPAWLRFFVNTNIQIEEKLLKQYSKELIQNLNGISGLKEELIERKGKQWLINLIQKLKNDKYRK